MKFSELEFKPYEGIHRACVEFKNGYGASVIIGYGTYGYRQGLYELAILHNGEICYDSGLANDVVGYLNEEEVEEWLGKIETLNENG